MKKRCASSTAPLCSKRKRGSNQMINEIKKEKVVVDPIINSELKEGTGNSDKVGICGICLEEVKTRGALNSCDHLFCFQCIYKWTKRSSTCPHCKRHVSSIKKTDPSGKIAEATLPVRRRNLSDTLDREEMQSRRRQVAVQRNRRNRTNAQAQAQARSFNRTNRRVDLNFNVSPSHLIQTHETIRNTIGYFSDVRALQESLCIDLNNAMRARIDVNMLPLHLNFSSYPTRTVMANVNVTVSNSNPYTHTVTQTTQRLTPSGSLNISQRTYSNMPRRPMMGVSQRGSVSQMHQPNMVQNMQPVHVQMAPAAPLTMRTPFRSDVRMVPGLDQLSLNLNESLQQAANVWEHQMQNLHPIQGQMPNQIRGNYPNNSQFPGPPNHGFQPRR